MKLIGFSFSKMCVERLGAKGEKLKINTKLDISDIQKLPDNPLKSEDEILEVAFSYIVEYSPGFAQVEFKGQFILALEPEKAQEVLDEWASKKISEDFKLAAFNIILSKSNIKALQLEEEMNLPPHFQLPKITTQSTKTDEN